jgi:hypothetical protein
MSSVEIRKRRSITQRIADIFKRKKSNAVHPDPAYFQANVDRDNDSLSATSSSATSSSREDSSEKEKDCVSIGRPESVVPSRNYSDISISAMIDIFEETRARKTFSSTTFTINEDYFRSSSVSLEDNSATSLHVPGAGVCYAMQVESRSKESVEETLVSQFRLELSDTSSSIDGDSMTWHELLQ